MVVGYTEKAEYANVTFSDGVENIAFDSQSGLNAPVFLRTVKLKSYPWNGSLRLGVPARAEAAWNPVAGFTDATGRLIWSAVADPAMILFPFNASWIPNRGDFEAERDPRPVRRRQGPGRCGPPATGHRRARAGGRVDVRLGEGPLRGPGLAVSGRHRDGDGGPRLSVRVRLSVGRRRPRRQGPGAAPAGGVGRCARPAGGPQSATRRKHRQADRRGPRGGPDHPRARGLPQGRAGR